MITALTIVLAVILVITSVLLVVLILLHRGKGGGLSDLFGGSLLAPAMISFTICVTIAGLAG